MKKKLEMMLILVAMCVAMLYIGNKRVVMTELPIDVVFDYYIDYWNVYDFSDTPFPTQEEFETQAKQYIIEICNLLTCEDFWSDVNADTEYMNIHVKFKNQSYSSTYHFLKN